MTDLILLRHGETVGQSSIRLYGATDIALSPIGELNHRKFFFMKERRIKGKV